MLTDRFSEYGPDFRDPVPGLRSALHFGNCRCQEARNTGCCHKGWYCPLRILIRAGNITAEMQVSGRRCSDSSLNTSAGIFFAVPCILPLAVLESLGHAYIQDASAGEISVAQEIAFYIFDDVFDLAFGFGIDCRGRP